MISASMRYKGFTWYHNPKSLKILNGTKVLNLNYPYSYSEASVMLKNNCVIQGEGELFGENCIEQFNALNKLFSEKGQGVLSIGGIPSFLVNFTKLNLLCEPKENILTYSFEFTECSSKEKRKTTINYHIAKKDETLWDIANIYSVSVKTLAKLNPRYKTPYSVVEKDKVIIC